MQHTVVIGLEVHVQLLTRTKLFCGCPNRFNPDHPNVQTCPVCLGLPGSLPVMNREAFLLALKTALALNCDITPSTKWDRKQYYYPDLPKAYQISQYDLPFSRDGWLEIETGTQTGERKRIGLIRAHLEEDAGKNLHDETGRGGDSRVDLNRAGTPLLEIVTQPDLRSAREAKAFLEGLKLVLMYLNVSDCNMQEGSLRCDANINLHVHTEDGHEFPTPIVEIKNLNSFRAVELALEHEAQRQLEEWQRTGHKLGDVPKQTRGWDADNNVTFAQRGKEEASDYRYFPDPDLVPVEVSSELVEEIKGSLCELPLDRRQRLQSAFQLSAYDAGVIVDQGIAFAGYYEHVAQSAGDGKLAANWVTQDVLRELKERELPIDRFPIPSPVLGALLRKIERREITTKSAREIFVELLSMAEAEGGVTPDCVDRIIDDKGLAIVSDSSELQAVVERIVSENQDTVEDVRAGKQQAVGPLIGRVMREVKGADPQLVRKMLLERIGG